MTAPTAHRTPLEPPPIAPRHPAQPAKIGPSSRHVGPGRVPAAASAHGPDPTTSPKTSARARARHPARGPDAAFHLSRYAIKSYVKSAVLNPSGFTPRFLRKPPIRPVFGKSPFSPLTRHPTNT